MVIRNNPNGHICRACSRARWLCSSSSSRFDPAAHLHELFVRHVRFRLLMRPTKSPDLGLAWLAQLRARAPSYLASAPLGALAYLPANKTVVSRSALRAAICTECGASKVENSAVPTRSPPPLASSSDSELHGGLGAAAAYLRGHVAGARTSSGACTSSAHAGRCRCRHASEGAQQSRVHGDGTLGPATCQSLRTHEPSRRRTLA